MFRVVKVRVVPTEHLDITHSNDNHGDDDDDDDDDDQLVPR